MKYNKILFASLLALSSAAYADGHYMGIRVEARDGSNSTADSHTYGLTLGNKFNNFLSGELHTRVKDEEKTNDNNTRLEAALIGSFPVFTGVSFYNRVAIGKKFENDDNANYWSTEPGVKWGFAPNLTLKTGVRFRDSFDTNKNDSTRTYRVGVEYALTEKSSVSVGVDKQVGDSEFKALGLGYSLKF